MLQAVFSIPAAQRRRLASLFPDQNGLIHACLDGCMGQAYGDHPIAPGAALLCIGDFACFGGNFLSPAARQLAGKLTLEKNKTWLIPAQMGWREHIDAWHPKSTTNSTRYAVEAKVAFDRSKLAEIIQSLPDDYVLQGINAPLYEKAMADEWSRDWCSQFSDAADYISRGMGVAALKNGELVAGASSYVVYDGGIEIQTDTRSDMRNRGLAAACCAKLILDCMVKGVHPSWDAANTASLRLAQKLGYTLKSPYDIWEVSF